MKIRKIIFIILAVLWMGMIFYFSSRDGDESSAMSNHAGKLFGHLFVAGYDDWTEQQQEAFAEKIDHPVRKCAHATEYALLGILLLGVKWNPFLSWVICFFYAGTDEFHQLFVPDRSGMFTDVLIDGGGALVGILVAVIIVGLGRKIKDSADNGPEKKRMKRKRMKRK